MKSVKTKESDFDSPSHSKSHCLVRVDFDDSYWLALFFKEPDIGSSVTVTKKPYVDMLEEAFLENSEGFQSSVFMQMNLQLTLQDWHSIDWRRPSRIGWFQTSLISCGPTFSWPKSLWFISVGLNEGRSSSRSTWQHYRSEATDPEFMASIEENLLQRVAIQIRFRVRRCIAARGGVFE